MKNRIKECRLAAGMTREELADVVGAPTETIKVVEESMEKNVASLTWFEGAAAVLHVSPAYLVGWSDDPGQPERSKEYAGGVVITLADGKKLYDHASIDDIYNCECDGLLCGDDNLVPIGNVAYVERIKENE